MLFFTQLFIFSMIEMKNVSLKENECGGGVGGGGGKEYAKAL